MPACILIFNVTEKKSKWDCINLWPRNPQCVSSPHVLNNLHLSILSGKCDAWALGKNTFLISWLCRKEAGEKCHEGGYNRDNRVNQSWRAHDRDFFETRTFCYRKPSYFKPKDEVWRELQLKGCVCCAKESVVSFWAARQTYMFPSSLNYLIS